jgi:cbb3-type cytochrome oxidase subunit 3
MLKELFRDISLFSLPVLGTCLFIAIFLTVLARVCQRARRAEYDRMANLPLADDISRSNLS